MQGFLTRLVGIALLLAGILGLVFAVAALVVVAQVQANMEGSIQQQLTLVDRALTATSDGLAIADTSLSQTVQTVGSLQGTIAGIGDTLSGSIPTLDAVAKLLGEDLPNTIEATQSTLSSAAASAQSVDGILKVLSALPFSSTEAYDPEVTLSAGLADVAASLNGIPESLRATQEGLAATSQSLSGVQGDFGAVASGIGAIGTSIESSRSVVSQYGGVLSDLRSMLGSVQASLGTWLGWARLGLSFLLVWLGIAQLALITQGLELIGRARRT
jgi:hypothetical protein